MTETASHKHYTASGEKVNHGIITNTKFPF